MNRAFLLVAAAMAGQAARGGSVAWTGELAILYLAAAIALLAAAVFSGSEIGIYSLSRVRLRLRMARGEKPALLLNQWLEEPTYALEGLLILQNLASFGFAAAVTSILHLYGFSEMAQTLISIAIVMPMVLIFADILPKDLFHARADAWIYRIVPLMRWLFQALTIIGLLPLVNGLSRFSTWLVGAGKTAPVAIGPRSEILTLFQESAATGVLTGTQQDLVQRALRLGRISMREVMIPWSRVIGVPSSISRDGFRALVRRYNVSRMPVLGRSTTEVLGIIDVLAVLTPRVAGGASPAGGVPAPAAFKVTDDLQPAMTLIGEQSVRSAITLMQRARQTIGIVVDHHGRAIGLVTMKDLIEELVGDLESW